MGGPGSGNWFRWQERKSTVEESLVVSMQSFRKRLYSNSAGSITWTSNSGSKSCLDYRMSWNDDSPRLTLEYRWRGQEEVRIPVNLEWTPTQFGGKRWWFTCPLTKRSLACNRRVSKLYLPPGAKFFGCRKCHDLTYQSSQEAHQAERGFARLGMDAECAALLASRWNRSIA